MGRLTIRGCCFLAAGLATVLGGVWVGERDFVRIGLLAGLLPALAWLVLRRTGRAVWVRRDLSSPQVEAGLTVHVEVKVGSTGRRTGQLLVREEVAAALGSPHSFVLDPLEPGAVRTVSYPVRTDSRGRHLLGPLHVRVPDPIRMVDLHRTVPSTTSVLVTPRTEPLPRIPLSGRRAGSGDNRTRDLRSGASPDVTVREYRLGDDLRRVHWPTSARTGELMVRREEQEWQARCTLLLDNRRSSHRGHGAASSMETAVGTAASILRNLVSRDFEVRLVCATGNSLPRSSHRRSRAATLPEQMERLALLTTTREEQLGTDWVRESQRGGMLIAVLGDLGEKDRSFLRDLARAGDSAYAVVLDVATWDPPGPPADTTAVTASLRASGWKATTLERDGSLAASWLELAR